MDYLKKIKSGFLFGIGIFLSFLLGFFVVNAWTSVGNVNSSDPLTVTLMNNIINKIKGIDYDEINNSVVFTGQIQLANTSNLCDSNNKGSLIFSGSAFYGCDGSDWSEFSGGGSSSIKTLELYGDGRRWSDGTYSKDCYSYKFTSSSEYIYAGFTGDGVYYIDPDGENGNSPIAVYCDMSFDGGGWTKVFYTETQLSESDIDSSSYNLANASSSGDFSILYNMKDLFYSGNQEFRINILKTDGSTIREAQWKQDTNFISSIGNVFITGKSECAFGTLKGLYLGSTYQATFGDSYEKCTLQVYNGSRWGCSVDHVDGYGLGPWDNVGATDNSAVTIWQR